jgi:hypothetical protein
MPHQRSYENEAAFQQEIVDLARFTGCYVYHTHDSRRSEKGLLDLIIMRPDFGVKWRELKIPPNWLSPEQEKVLGLLLECGEDAKVWTPHDWGEIEQLLAKRHGKFGSVPSGARPRRIGRGG